MEQHPLRLTILFSLVLVSLYAAGYFFPSALTWGFHFLGFLPSSVFYLYLIIVLTGLFFIMKKDIDGIVAPVSSFMVRKPTLFLFIVIVVAIGCIYLLRVRVPLLGDSFFLVKNYSEASRGVAPLYPRNEPLSTYYFSFFMNLFGVSSYKQFLNVFLLADILLGIGFIICTFIIVQHLFSEKETRFSSFIYLLTIPTVQLFFGYVETYAVVLLAVSLYTLVAVLYLKQKIPFFPLPIIFLVQTLTHYFTLLLFPSLLYLAYLEMKNRGGKKVLLSFGTTVGIILILLIAVNFEVEKFSAWTPHSHFLSVVESTNPFEKYSQAYTLFSPYHFIDVLNLFILLSPGALFLVFLTLYYRKHVSLRSATSKFFVSAIVPVFMVLFVTKFDLGMSRDWDIFAPYFFLLSLFAVFIFFESGLPNGRKIFSITIIVTIANSLVWFYLNSTTDASIRRYTSLLDKRIVSQGGFYSANLYLSMYYHQIRDLKSPIQLWSDYIDLYPMDNRGYVNVINNLRPAGKSAYEKMIETYERWLKNDPNSPVARNHYVNFCVETGNGYFGEMNLRQAALYYQKAIELDTNNSRAYNNLGSVCAQQENYAQAIAFFQKAIDLDSSYAEAYYNLGHVYTEKGESQKGIAYVKRAAQLGNPTAQKLLQALNETW